MSSVFLSYSSQDRERVAVLAEGLRAEGFEVWWDREIPVGLSYEEHIRQQLDTAGAAVVVWSAAAVASRYVRWEAQRAELRRVLMPVLIEPTDLPPEYFLIQAADLTRWEGDRADREWQRLVAALLRLGVTREVRSMEGTQPTPAGSPPETASRPPVAKTGQALAPVEEDGPRSGDFAAEPLPIEWRSRGLGLVADLNARLREVGLEVVRSQGATPALYTFTDSELERLAELEHHYWMTDKLVDQWRWGPYKDSQARISPYLVPWDQLPEQVKEFDRLFVRAIPGALARLGYEVRKTG